MDYEDDLNAPVWDDLNPPNQAPISELSNTFADLHTDEGNQEEENKSNDNDEEGHSVDHDDSDNLLNKLAPQEDPLLDLQTANDPSILSSPIKAADDPLFSSSTYQPLVFGDNNDQELSQSAPVLSQGSRRSGKPRMLFNSARMRRRPLNKKADGATGSTNINTDDNKNKSSEVIDPLGKIERGTERTIDEDPTSATSNNTTKSKSIIEQVDEPLFKVPTRRNLGEDKLQSGFTEVQTQQEQTQDEDHKPVYFHVEVKDPVKVGELTSMHVEYTVVVESELLKTRHAQVNRRYTDFRWLYRQLQSNHWGRIIPPPPEKQSVGRFKQDFIENRRFQMEKMLRKIASNPILQSDFDFILFLTSDNFSFESKHREHITGSNASRDSNDLSEIHISEIELLGADDAATVLKNGGLDGESQKTFLSLSFSSLPKYNELDEYFIDQYKLTESLEERLKQLNKSLDLVDSERNELASVTEEFSKTIDSLAELEVTKQNIEILTNFADTHRRIKESLERSSLQESLTLGVTLDEYIRSLASVKAIFNQRSRLGYYLVIVETDFAKKQSYLERLPHNSASQSNIVKINAARREYQTLQKRCKAVKSRWQEAGDCIKKELANFEVEKVRDFRNSLEIFLESAIESQKECIEMWETFYQNNL